MSSFYAYFDQEMDKVYKIWSRKRDCCLEVKRLTAFESRSPNHRDYRDIPEDIVHWGLQFGDKESPPPHESVPIRIHYYYHYSWNDGVVNTSILRDRELCFFYRDYIFFHYLEDLYYVGDKGESVSVHIRTSSPFISSFFKSILDKNYAIDYSTVPETLIFSSGKTLYRIDTILPGLTKSGKRVPKFRILFQTESGENIQYIKLDSRARIWTLESSRRVNKLLTVYNPDFEKLFSFPLYPVLSPNKLFVSDRVKMIGEEIKEDLDGKFYLKYKTRIQRPGESDATSNTVFLLRFEGIFV